MKNAKLLFADHFLEQEEEDVVLVEPTPVESLPPVEPTPEPSPQVITDQYKMMLTNDHGGHKIMVLLLL